ncbi:HTH-type transcriptional activator Btr [bioreactor metagenome]|uniref:HTH-type transcriptional activator Btr n=1 Tax=bioreactor metagenome TaxID=1076179 RepID=A0A645CTE6_9ZZZZ
MREIEFYRDNDLPFFELKSCNTSELSYKKHAHEEYSIGIVDQGKSYFWYDGKVDEVHSKTMVFLPPDLIHSCNPVNRSQWEYKMLYVCKEWVQGFMESRKSYKLNNPIVKNVSNCGTIKTVSGILENLKAKSNPLEKEASILAVFELALSGEKKVCLVNFKSEQPKLKIIKEYLQNYFNQKVTLDQLEQVSGINKFHIIRLFKEQFRIPPHAFQTMLRINYAKKELGKHRQMTEIALDAGFYDQSHFIKVFKSYTGVTPDRYQKFI